MHLLKATSWGLIIGGLTFVLGFMIVGFTLGLTDDAITVSEEFDASMENRTFLAVFALLFAAAFAYLAKSILQVAEAVKVTDQWFMYARILLITMLALLLAQLSMFMLIPEEATIESFTAMDHIGSAISSMTNGLSAFVFLIIAVFTFKNGAGNAIFKAVIGLLGVLSILDVISVIGVIDGDSIGFITWILWGLAIAIIGVLGLVTKEA